MLGEVTGDRPPHHLLARRADRRRRPAHRRGRRPGLRAPGRLPDLDRRAAGDDSASALAARLDARHAARASSCSSSASPNLADTAWVTNQYDYYVHGQHRPVASPTTPGMIRVDEDSGLGFAIATDCNGRFCQLDPYEGAKLALAEAYRNVAVTGARADRRSPTASTSAAPRTPRSCGSSREAVEGLADGCLELGIPVTGGNVSFYNQTGDQPIHPTPVVGVLGIIDDVARRIPSRLAGRRARTSTCSASRATELERLGVGRHRARPPRRPPAGRRPRAREARSPSCCTRPPQQALIDSAPRPRRRRTRAGAGRGGAALRRRRAGVARRAHASATGWMPRPRCSRESTGRVIVSVPREDDVKFRGPVRGPRLPGAAHRRDRSPRRSGVARGAGPVHRADRGAPHGEPRAARRRVRPGRRVLTHDRDRGSTTVDQTMNGRGAEALPDRLRRRARPLRG